MMLSDRVIIVKYYAHIIYTFVNPIKNVPLEYHPIQPDKHHKLNKPYCDILQTYFLVSH